MKFIVTVWDPLDWRLSPSFLEVVCERGYVPVTWSLVSNELPSKDPSLYTEGLLSLSCMGGSGLNWIWVGAGIQDHILGKVTELGRRPSLPTQLFFPRRPLFPEVGPGQHSAVSSETGSCQLGKCSGWALLITPYKKGSFMWSFLSSSRAIRVYRIAEGLTKELLVLFDWTKLHVCWYKKAFKFYSS